MTARKPRPVGRQTEMMTVRLPPELMRRVEEEPEPKSTLTRRALDAFLFGGVQKWEARYREERARRLQLEQALRRAREALDV